MAKLLKYSLLLGVAAFFAVMWGLLLRSHLPMRDAERLRPSYDNLLKPGQDERSAAWGIYFAGRRIGQSNTKVWRGQDGTISIRTITEIHLETAARYILGVTGTLDVDFTATISPLRGLQSFEIESDLLNTSLLGTVRQDRILINGHIGEDTVRTSMPYDEHRLLGQVLAPPTTLPPLDEGSPGQAWTLDMVNPVAGKVEQVTVSIIGFKDLVLAEETTRVFKLLFATRNKHWISWVTDDGEVLVQGTPFGLRLQRDDIPQDALAELEAGAGPQRLPPP